MAGPVESHDSHLSNRPRDEDGQRRRLPGHWPLLVGNCDRAGRVQQEVTWEEGAPGGVWEERRTPGEQGGALVCVSLHLGERKGGSPAQSSCSPEKRSPPPLPGRARPRVAGLPEGATREGGVQRAMLLPLHWPLG